MIQCNLRLSAGPRIRLYRFLDTVFGYNSIISTFDWPPNNFAAPCHEKKRLFGVVILDIDLVNMSVPNLDELFLKFFQSDRRTVIEPSMAEDESHGIDMTTG